MNLNSNTILLIQMILVILCIIVGTFLGVFFGKRYRKKKDKMIAEGLCNAEPIYIEDQASRSKYIITIVAYFAFFYIVASILSVIISFIVLIIKGYSMDSMVEGSKEYLDYYNTTLTWTNFLTYLGSCAVVLPLVGPKLIKDMKRFSGNAKFYLKWWGIGFAMMYGAAILANIITNIFSLGLEAPGNSENQEAINTLMASGGLNYAIIAIVTVLIAPVLEELIFRKALFGLFKKDTFLPVIISSILFAGIHVFPACAQILLNIVTHDATWLDFHLEFICIFSYLAQAIALSFVYYKTKRNLIPCILIHFTNNLIALILNTILIFAPQLLG
ncbi:MAG: CPBP family intramembrane metalloprotease [Prevotella sp.]|nr:CPBP family intramembrane metalloprotease [Staphylococcus sp.]MCM1349711.1 CPBP family intramembrane metalloprotease [Prevotella sp.]